MKEFIATIFNPILLSLVIIGASRSISFAQEFSWQTTEDGIFRDGTAFFLRGQSWAKKTAFTYTKGEAAEDEVKKVLSELSEIGVNTIRIYGSPNDSDWSGTSNFDHLIKWIDEWNIDNPDQGDPNKAMYYLVQLSPADPQSSIASNLPEMSTESFDRAINDLDNNESVASLIARVNEVTGGSQYLLGYLIYHELNVSSKYSEWRDTIGLQGIEDFMNVVADSIHNNYAPGKLVSHTGDAKDDDDDIYQGIEELDTESGNVFQNFDLIGFNLYISTHAMLSENSFYERIGNRRALSVNADRGWFIGETGPSFDKSANSSAVAAANYTNPEGGANLQLMYANSRKLGNLIGFTLFTVQDNDLGTPIGDDIKQRGFYDVYGEKKYLYYIYPDIIDQISSNERIHLADDYKMELSVEDNTESYLLNLEIENSSNSTSHQVLWTVYRDNGSGGNQRFGEEITYEFIDVLPCEHLEISKIVEKSSEDQLVVASASLIDDLTPDNAYLWGREHVLSDAICTVAGLNIDLTILPEDRPDMENCEALPADLDIQGKVNHSEPFIGDTVAFTFYAINHGASDATSVMVDLTMDSGYELTEDASTLSDLDQDAMQWNIGLLRNQGSDSIVLNAIIKETDDYTFRTVISGDQEDRDDSNNEVIIETDPEIVLSLSPKQHLHPSLSGKILLGSNSVLRIPEGSWLMKVFDLTGTQLMAKHVSGFQLVRIDGLGTSKRLGVYLLEPTRPIK